MNHTTHNNNNAKQYTPSMKATGGIYPDYDFEDPQIIRGLTSNLMYLFNLPDGNHLTFILGHGECSNNRQAIQCWLYDQLRDYSNGEDVLCYLTEQLKDQLTQEWLS